MIFYLNTYRINPKYNMILVPARTKSIGLEKLSSSRTELLGTGVYLQNKKTFDHNDAENIKNWIKTKWREEWMEIPKNSIQTFLRTVGRKNLNTRYFVKKHQLGGR